MAITFECSVLTLDCGQLPATDNPNLGFRSYINHTFPQTHFNSTNLFNVWLTLGLQLTIFFISIVFWISTSFSWWNIQSTQIQKITWCPTGVNKTTLTLLLELCVALIPIARNMCKRPILYIHFTLSSVPPPYHVSQLSRYIQGTLHCRNVENIRYKRACRGQSSFSSLSN